MALTDEQRAELDAAFLDWLADDDASAELLDHLAPLIARMVTEAEQRGFERGVNATFDTDGALIEAEQRGRAAGWDEGAAKASPYGGGYLRSLYAENPYRITP